MSIRNESNEFKEALTKALLRLTDQVPNGKEAGAILADTFETITEGTDFAKMPQEDRLNALILATIGTLDNLASVKIVFSDEQENPA